MLKIFFGNLSRINGFIKLADTICVSSHQSSRYPDPLLMVDLSVFSLTEMDFTARSEFTRTWARRCCSIHLTDTMSASLPMVRPELGKATR